MSFRFHSAFVKQRRHLQTFCSLHPALSWPRGVICYLFGVLKPFDVMTDTRTRTSRHIMQRTTLASSLPSTHTEMRWLLKFPVISFLKEIHRRKLRAEQIVANFILVVILFSCCWSRKLKQSCNESRTQEPLIRFLCVKWWGHGQMR